MGDAVGSVQGSVSPGAIEGYSMSAGDEQQEIKTEQQRWGRLDGENHRRFD